MVRSLHAERARWPSLRAGAPRDAANNHAAGRSAMSRSTEQGGGSQQRELAGRDGVRRREVFGLSAAGATGAAIAAGALAMPLVREARAQGSGGSRLQTVLE